MNTKYTDVFNQNKQSAMRNFFLNELGPLGKIEGYKRGTTFAKDIEDEMYIVKKGKVKVALNEEAGEEQLVYTIVSGEILGEFEVLSEVGQNYLLHFEEDSEMWRVSKDTIRRTLKDNPATYDYLIHSMTRKYNLALYQVSFNRFYSSDERIVEFLMRVARSRYPDMKRDIRVEGYTHEDIGNSINISRIGVTNSLKGLKEMGLIEIRRKLVIIRSIEELEEYRGRIKKR